MLAVVAGARTLILFVGMAAHDSSIGLSHAQGEAGRRGRFTVGGLILDPRLKGMNKINYSCGLKSAASSKLRVLTLRDESRQLMTFRLGLRVKAGA